MAAYASNVVPSSTIHIEAAAEVRLAMCASIMYQLDHIPAHKAGFAIGVYFYQASMVPVGNAEGHQV